MFCIKNNEKNKSAVILNPERSEWVSRSHVTSVESVINDRAKTKRYSAKRDLYGDFAYAQPLKMTEKTLSFLRLRGASGAQGISAPASCREAHKRRFLLNQWILRFVCTPLRMTIPALALLFTIATTAESLAECIAQEFDGWNKDCYSAWNPGFADNCGDGCTYTYDNGKLTVTATKPGAVIPEGFFSPRYYENGVYPNITGIEIAGEFDTIGMHAFANKRTTISGKGGILYVNNIGHNAFGNNTLTGTIIVNDKQTTLGEGPWYSANLNATVILPPTIKSISGWALYGLKLVANAKIYCGAENCEELFKNVNCEGFSTNETYRTLCKNRLKTLLASGKLLAYPDGCTKMGASGCTKCKNSNFKLNDGECDRLRYTPAEAAKVLKDDNTNSVTITFKK